MLPIPSVISELNPHCACLAFYINATDKAMPCSSVGPYSIFLQDADGGVPFYWGADSEDHVVLSDDAEIVKNACGKSCALFPKGINKFTINQPKSSKVPLIFFLAL